MAAPFVDNAFSTQWPNQHTSTETQIKQAASRNGELLAVLARTDSAKPALKQQNEYIEQLQIALTKVADKAKQLALVRQKEEKDHQSYHESVMKRFAYKVGGKKDKFIEKASKEEREYFEALRGEKRAQEEGKSLTEQLRAALQTKSQLEPLVAESKRAQKELDDLYNAIFEGQTVSFPEEDAQEMAAMQAHNESEHLQFILSRETQVKQLLADARVSMIEALSRVEGALDHSRVDMFGGGALWDYLERRDLGKVDQAINEVHRLVVQAQRLSPYVLPLGPVSVAQNSLMGDVLFDNIISDHHFHQKIKQTRDELKAAAEGLKENSEQTEKRLQGIQVELSKASRCLEEERVKLQRLREHIFEQTLGRAYGTS